MIILFRRKTITVRRGNLKLKSHGILRIICCQRIYQKFSQLIISIFIFSQYFFNIFCPVEMCEVVHIAYIVINWLYVKNSVISITLDKQTMSSIRSVGFLSRILFLLPIFTIICDDRVW